MCTGHRKRELEFKEGNCVALSGYVCALCGRDSLVCVDSWKVKEVVLVCGRETCVVRWAEGEVEMGGMLGCRRDQEWLRMWVDDEECVKCRRVRTVAFV